MNHGNFMGELHKEGILILGGPFDDGSGGQSVIKVDSFEEAKKIADKDPAILEGVFDVRIVPWLIAFEQ